MPAAASEPDETDTIPRKNQRKKKGKNQEDEEDGGDGAPVSGKATFAKRAKSAAWPAKWTTIRQVFEEHIKSKIHLQVWGEDRYAI